MKDILSTIGCAVLSLALIVALSVGAYFAVPAVWQWGVDVTRNVTQHSQSYQESRLQELNQFITDYNEPDATPGQKQAIVNEFCYKVTLVKGDIPANIVQFDTAHC